MTTYASRREAAVSEAGARLRQSAKRERDDRDALYDEIRAAVAAGMSEAQAARLARIDRMTVRRILGKL